MRNTGIALLIILAVLAGVYGVYRQRAHSRLVAAVDEIKATGAPVTLDELNAWYEDVPAAENAANVYGEAFEAFDDIEKRLPSVPIVGGADLPDRTEPVSDEMKAATAQYLERQGQALELLHRAARLRKCRFPLDLTQGPQVQLPHLSQLRHAARLLSLEAVFRAENQEGEGAAQSLVAALAVGRSLQNEPLIISQLVRFACDKIVSDALEQVLNRTPLADDQLADLGQAVAEAGLPGGLTRAFIGERSSFLASITKQRETATPRRGALRKAYFEWSGFEDIDRAAYLGYMSRLIETDGLSPPESLDTIAALADEASNLSPWRRPLTRVLMPALARAKEAEPRHAAHIYLAQAALAIERYRLTNGDPPARLAELVPSYLGQAPKDPFDGEELRYLKKSSEYVVYSIGPNRRDDRGKQGEDARFSGDVTLTVALRP